MKSLKLFLTLLSAVLAFHLFAAFAWSANQDADSWRGLYAGVSAGARLLTSYWTTNALIPSEGSLPIEPTTANPSFNSNSARFGGYLGYNFDLNSSWLLGGESDFAWGNNSKTVIGVPGTAPTTIGGITNPDNTTVGTSWDSSFRARAGYLLASNWLIYGTGGLALTRTKATENCYIQGFWCGDGNHFETFSTTMVGWTLGAGIETLFTENWIVRLEYRYADYGSFTHTFLPAGSFDDNTATIKVKSSIISLGAAYKFKW